MADVTFSSPLSPPAFTSFTVDVADSQALQQLTDESATRFALSIVGSGARAAQAKLAPIETKAVLNGGPLMTLGGHIVAAAIGQGQLVQAVFDVLQRGQTNDKETVTIVGIVTNLVWTASSGPMGQRLDFVLNRCHRLHVRAGGTVTTSTDPAVS